ncbi:hypothetical protein I79_026065 [Cricetulus griseus]|uniref:Uncharacterized protein n=1 Tax=Cricetulus griseus TaxID=10029 RepID=G3IPY0_CRIGR|nr:hypothetical protein I79_026065 [Cricetulus griseus]
MDLSLELCDFSDFTLEKMTVQRETLGNTLRNLRALGKLSVCARLYVCMLCVNVSSANSQVIVLIAIQCPL